MSFSEPWKFFGKFMCDDRTHFLQKIRNPIFLMQQWPLLMCLYQAQLTVISAIVRCLRFIIQKYKGSLRKPSPFLISRKLYEPESKIYE